MLKSEVKRVYEEFCKESKLVLREPQLKGMCFCLLPYYGNTTVIGEGQTGMGKTISYLFPLVLKRYEKFQTVPLFLAEDMTGEYFLRDGSMEKIVESYIAEADEEKVAKAVEKAQFVGERAVVVTATKMLQDQIVEKDLKVINSFLRKKGLSEINHVVLTGSKNFICASKISEEIKRLEKEKEKAQENLKTGIFLESVKQEVKNHVESLDKVIVYLRRLEEKGVTSFDEMRDVFRYEERKEAELLFEEFGVDISASGLKVKLSETGHFFYPSRRCNKCDKSCVVKERALKSNTAELLVMNYYYFSFFVRRLTEVKGYLKKFKKSLIELTGVNPDFHETLVSFLEEVAKKIDPLNDKSMYERIKKDFKNYSRVRDIYKSWTERTVFVFDEAHCFERDLLSSLTQTVDLSEIRDTSKKLSDRFSKLEEVLLNLYGVSGLSESLVKSISRFKESVIHFLSFSQNFYDLFRDSMEELKQEWSKGKDTELEDLGFFFVRRLFQQKEKSDRYREEWEYFCDSLYKFCSRNKGKEELIGIEEFKKQLAECFDRIFSMEFVGKLEKLFCLWCMHVYLNEANDSLLNFYNLACELKSQRSVLSENSSPLWRIILEVHFPYTRLKKFREELRILDNAFRSYVGQTYGEARLKDFTSLSNFFEESKKKYEVFKYFHKDSEFLMDLHKKRSERVCMDGWSVNLMGGEVRKFLNEGFENWDKVRKIFISATIGVPVIRNGRFTGISFDYFVRSAGINDKDRVACFVVGSPFNLKEQSVMYIPQDIPYVVDGKGNLTDEWKDYIRNKVKELVNYVDGGVLILTTSKDIQRMIYEELKKLVEENDKIEVFCQELHSMKTIRSRFGSEEALKEGKKQILVSLNTYWQGFDVPGKGLRHIIIPKLPFEEPKSPYNVMVVEREVYRLAEFLAKKKGIDFLTAYEIAEKKMFYQIVVPKAILQFKQGVGRLIRTETDWGMITLLDRRIYDNNYGLCFLHAVRGIPVVRDKKHVESFLEKAREKFEEIESEEKKSLVPTSNRRGRGKAVMSL